MLLLTSCGTPQDIKSDVVSESEKSFNKHLRTAYESIETRNYDAAIPELNACIEQSRHEVDKRHLMLALHTLAEAQFKKGELETAANNCSESIKVAKERYEAQTVHSQRRDWGMSLGKAQQLMARILREQKKSAEAITYYREAMQTIDAVIGPQFMREEMLKECSALQKELGQSDEAEVDEQKKIDVKLKIVETAGLASRMATKKDFAAAEKLHLEAIAIAEKYDRLHEKEALESLEWLIIRYQEEGRFEDSEKMIEKMDQWLRKTHHTKGFLVSKNMMNRGLLHVKKKDWKAAQQDFHKAFDGAQALKGESDNAIMLAASAANQLGNAYYCDDHLKQAKAWYQTSLDNVNQCKNPNMELCRFLGVRIKHLEDKGI